MKSFALALLMSCVRSSSMWESVEDSHGRLVLVQMGAKRSSDSFPSLHEKRRKPNVLLILVDDLNADIGHLIHTGSLSHPQTKTPQIDGFSESAVTFSRAYANHPICNPSRSSFLSGIYGHKSGQMYTDRWTDNKMLAASSNLMQHFKNNGYYVLGTGKIEHDTQKEDWDLFENPTDFGPLAFDGISTARHPSVPESVGLDPLDLNFAPLSDVPFGGWVLTRHMKESLLGVPDGVYPYFYGNETDRDPTPDEKNADWVVSQIETLSNRADPPPFFLSVGFVRPHTPMNCPGSYFDMFPLEDLLLQKGSNESKYLTVNDNGAGHYFYDELQKTYEGDMGLRKVLQAYLACVSFVDQQIGTVINAVDQSPLKDNTIVIMAGDNGWSNGGHNWVYKNMPYEEATRVPLMIRVPGVTPATGGKQEAPVSLIDLYPTLIDLCGLSTDTKKDKNAGDLDGHSLLPLLQNPGDVSWSGPAGALSVVPCYAYVYGGKVTSCKNNMAAQHYSIRTARWRYTLYAGGVLEELFDHDQDMFELTDLADEEHEGVMNRLLEMMRNVSGIAELHRP